MSKNLRDILSINRAHETQNGSMNHQSGLLTALIVHVLNNTGQKKPLPGQRLLILIVEREPRFGLFTGR